MKRYSKRIGLLAGVLVFALVLLLSGEFVWEIRVNGNELVSEQEILQSLEEMGLKRGVWKTVWMYRSWHCLCEESIMRSDGRRST